MNWTQRPFIRDSLYSPPWEEGGGLQFQDIDLDTVDLETGKDSEKLNSELRELEKKY